ncbi:MAG TPA: NUDIX domain-containing protein [Gemmatimonadales bacterium]
MSTVRVSLVDVYVLRGTGEALECLVLQRAAGGRCPGSWETVHGHIEGDELPDQAARRELREETGLVPLKLYNLSRVECFYQHRRDEVALVPVFAAIVDSKAEARVSEEHDRAEWLPWRQAEARFSWPRERRAIGDAVALLSAGEAGPLEDVLRVC